MQVKNCLFIKPNTSHNKKVTAHKKCYIPISEQLGYPNADKFINSKHKRRN